MKYFLLFLFLFSAAYSGAQSFINDPCFFVGVDEMYYYKQSHDTLYAGVAHAVNPKYLTHYDNHFKIWALRKRNPDFYILKVEKLDKLPLTTNPYPDDRYGILIFRKTDKTVSLLQQISSLTKAEMRHYQTDTIHYQNAFAYDYYSLKYMRQLMKLKRVKTLDDAKEIIKWFENPKNYSSLVNNYKAHNKMPDSYGAGLAAALINKICIDLGYCPIGASIAINTLKSNKTKEQKRKKIERYYKIVFRK